MLKTKRSDALVDIAKRRRELLGSAVSAAPNPKSSAPLADDDIFEVDPDVTPAAPPSAASSSAQEKLEQPRSKAVSEKLKAILEDNDTGQATHAKSCRSKSAVVSHSVLLAQQKLLMLKALEESSLQASILPIVQPAVVDFDDEDEHPHALQSSASSHDAGSPQLIRLKFLAKTKQQVVVDVEPNKPLVSYYPAIALKFGVVAVKVMCEGRPITSGDSAESLDLEEDFGLDVVLL